MWSFASFLMDSRGQRLRNRERYLSCEEESPPCKPHELFS
jgi:hypothetical protein